MLVNPCPEKQAVNSLQTAYEIPFGSPLPHTMTTSTMKPNRDRDISKDCMFDMVYLVLRTLTMGAPIYTTKTMAYVGEMVE